MMWPFKKKTYTIDLIVDLSCGEVGKLQRHVQRAVKYRKDMGLCDEWKGPERTLLEGRGDCEDFAVLYYTLLKRLGHSPKIICGYPKRPSKTPGHAIVVFEIKGTWLYTTNYWLQFAHVRCKDFLQAAQFAMRDMDFYVEKNEFGRTLEVLGTND